MLLHGLIHSAMSMTNHDMAHTYTLPELWQQQRIGSYCAFGLHLNTHARMQ
jgi:hypothetical protein